MKLFTLTRIAFFSIVVLFSLPVLGQIRDNPIQEHGRKYLPEPPIQSNYLTSSNTDAPAGSISVAEDLLYNSYTPQQLVQNLLVTGCLTASNIRYGYYVKIGSTWTWTNHTWSATPGNRQMAYFNKATSTFPLDEGIVLSTGKASSAMGPNNVGNKSDKMEVTASDPDLATITGRTMYDASVLEFDFIPAGNTVEFTYVFASEEYIEYCETEFNDAFGFFLSGPGISGSYSNNARNLATIQGEIPVSINTIHPAGTNVNNVAFPAENVQYYLNNPNGSLTMQYDGSTVALTATYPVVPCSTYRIRMSVADASDQLWDAAVFMGARSFNSENINLTNFGNFIEGETNIFEGCNNFFRVARSNPDISQPLTVNLILSGTCTNGVDIQTTGNQPFPNSVTIPGNASFIDIPYTAIDDGLSDNGETFIIQVITSCPCAVNQVTVTQTITIYEQVVISSVNAINAQCNGQNNGTITVNATGGSGSYLYSINNGTTWQSINNFTGLSPGNYTVLVNDPGSCNLDASATATIGNPVPIIANAGPDVTICSGTSAQLNGTGGVQYSWSPATGLNFTNIANPIASPAATTIYTLTVTNATGQCESTDQVIVTVNPNAVAPTSASVDRIIFCNDDNENIVLTATGGSGTTLNWFTGGCGSTGIGNGNSLSIPSPDITTAYYVRWENSCGNSSCAQVSVIVPIAIVASVSAEAIACNNGTTTLTVTANGGTGSLQYSLNGGAYQSSNTFTVDASGSPYTATVKDANNCTITTSPISLTQPAGIVFDTSLVTHVGCFGGIDGQIMVSTTGGTGIITYSISPNVGFQSPSGSFNNLTAQAYNITATDANGCTKDTIVTVGTNVDDTPPVIVTCAPAQSAIANESCQAAVPNFTANVTATDNCTAASALTITQSPAAGTLVSAGLTNVVITVTDAVGNYASCNASFTVTDIQNPTISGPGNIIVNADPGLCSSSSVNLGTPVTSDNCGIAGVTNNAPTQFLVGTTSVTWTATDLSELFATSIQLVTVIDNQPPSIICPPTITVGADTGQSYATGVNLGTPITSDNCGVSSVTNNAPVQFPLGTTTVTWTVIDVNGLSTTCTQTVVVTDNQSLIISCPPTITVNCITEVPVAYSTYNEFVVAGGSASDNDGINPASFSLVGQTSNGMTCPETIIRIYTIADNNGNFNTCSQLIIVDDNTAPVLSVPADVTVECLAVPAVGTATAIDNCDASVTIIYEGETRINGACAGSYSVTRTWTATDACNNSSTASQTIHVQDNSAPSIVTLPEPSTINCPAVPEFATATAVDECGSAFTLTYNDVTTPGACAGSYSVTRTWTATDACNNTSTASQTIHVQDNSAPLIVTLPEPSTINCPAVPEFATATAVDECGSAFTLIYNDVTTPGACAGSYSVTRTWTATDACNNTSTASQTIHVQDNSAPLIVALPEPSTINCPAVPEFVTATAVDECGSAFTLIYNDVTTPGACAGSYSVTRTWTATDACNNTSTASQTIHVQDNSAPLIVTLPEPSTINCPAVPEFVTATAVDECSSAFTLTYNDVITPGACAGSYSVTRTWTATDACKNTATASQTINVQDNSAPLIVTLPEPSTINCPAVPEFATATAVDECGSSFTLTYNDVTTAGACAGSYSVTRTWTATDACNNTSTASQTINVQDNSAPLIVILPEPSTINCPAVPEFATATAVDECGSAFTLTYNDVTTPGACAGSYSVTRTWTATDACNNTSTASQTIHVQDNSAPLIVTLPEPSTINCPAVPEFVTATAVDECGSSFTLTYNDVTTPGACAGSYSVTRTWTATDACNNTSTASQTINVQDNSAPLIVTLPEPSTINCPAVPEFATATAVDECGSAFTLTYNDVTTPGACAGSYSVTRTWTATDACNNTATASQTIHVQDNSAPLIVTLPEPSTINCPAVPEFVTATAVDECGSAFTLTYEDVTTPGACAGSYSVTRTWTATDACNNTSTASQTIHVQDNSAPSIVTLPEPSTINCPAVPEFATATAVDECGSAFTLTYNDVTTPGACAGSYSVTRTWTATDACNNTSTASQTINVQDITAPVVTCPSNMNLNNDPGACGANVLVPQPTYVENCGSVTLVNSVNSTSNASGFYPTGISEVSWTVTDDCGNASNCSMTVTVIDTELPVITCPADLVLCSAENIVLGNATATDNCGTPGIYNNAPATFLLGTTIVTWTATDTSGNTAICQQSVTLLPMTTADAGTDDLICQGTASYQVTGASATNYSSLLWTTTGMGTLLNATTLNPTYIPQTGETGNIYLTLTANGIAPCNNAIDQMLLTIIPGPTVSAGNDESLCEGEVFVPVTAYAGNYNSLLWSSNGTGSFTNPTILNPTYTPSPEDILNGSVVLTITAYGSAPCGNLSDNMILTIFRASIANAGPDESTCQGVPYTITGATASNYTSVTWTHNGSGTLTGANTLIPTYTPAMNETGMVTLSLNITGLGSCGNISDAMELTIYGTPHVFAGNDAVSCDVVPFILSSATITGAESLLWSTSGTGIFSDPSLLNSVYTPSASDVTNGSVILLLTVTGYTPCGIATDGLILTLTRAASANAGPDAIICNNSTFKVNEASASGLSSIHWSHNGSGMLTGENTLTPTYTPANGESGIVTLTLSVTGIIPCGNATDSMIIEMIPAIIAYGGADLNTCEVSPITISLASASNYTSISWTSSGTGSFNDSTALNPIYTPSQADATAGVVVLNMNVTGIAPCSNFNDQVTLTIQKGPEVNAGSDVTSCNGIPYTLTGATAINFSSLLWSHNGNGTLSNSNTLIPAYTPAEDETGPITLTLNVQGYLACASILAIDQVNLTIGHPIMVNAGPDQTIPTGANTTLNATASGGSGFLSYSWEPAGLVSSPTTLTTNTEPLTSTTTFTFTTQDISTGCRSSDVMQVFMGTANLPPVAEPDYDTASVILPAVVNVLENDYDPDGTITSVSIIAYPSNGIIFLNDDNTITYTPEGGFDGTDTFIYQICDNGTPTLCDTALVTIRVFGQRPFDDIVIYNYLTPNSDSHNDVWIIENIQFWPENEVLIFNRWGDRIKAFEHYDNTTKVWDGTNEEGRAIPDGTYFYILKVKHLDAQTGSLREDAKPGFILVSSNRQ